MFTIARHIPFGRHGVKIERHALLDMANHTPQVPKTHAEEDFDIIKNNLKVGDRVSGTNAKGKKTFGKVSSINMNKSTGRPTVQVKNLATNTVEDLIPSTIERLVESYRPKTFAEFLLQ